MNIKRAQQFEDIETGDMSGFIEFELTDEEMQRAKQFKEKIEEELKRRIESDDS